MIIDISVIFIKIGTLPTSVLINFFEKIFIQFYKFNKFLTLKLYKSFFSGD